MPENKSNSKAFTVKDLLLYILSGLMILCGGVLVFLWYSNPRDYALFGVVGIGIIAGGGYFMYSSMNMPKTGTVVNIDRLVPITGYENCINLYVKKKQRGYGCPR